MSVGVCGGQLHTSQQTGLGDSDRKLTRITHFQESGSQGLLPRAGHILQFTEQSCIISPARDKESK